MDTGTKRRIEYRGFVLELVQESKSQLWTLYYRLNGHSPTKAKFHWKTTAEAEAHGKRMIDSLFES